MLSRVGRASRNPAVTSVILTTPQQQFLVTTFYSIRLTMAPPALSNDVLHVLCEELALQEEFDTLFHCACSSRSLAVPALTHLYRYVPFTFEGLYLPKSCLLRFSSLAAAVLKYEADTPGSSHHLAPVRGGGDDETGRMATKQLMVQKWSILWRSIIASSLDATLFPYCRYIKVLDLRDLRYLLEDDLFRGKTVKCVSSVHGSPWTAQTPDIILKLTGRSWHQNSR